MGSLSSTIGAATGALSTVTQAATLANTLTGESSDNRTLRQLQENNQIREASLAQDNALQKQQLALEAQQASEDRRIGLRRAVARQNALTGASGIVSGDGSSEAVLLGLYNENDQEAQQRAELDNLRTAALDQNLTQTRQLNLLQENQLKEDQGAKNSLSIFGDLF